jgi:hypothetical protein
VSLQATEGYLREFFGGRPPADWLGPELRPPSREQILQSLNVPSPHFAARGFAPAVLARFGVGHSPLLNATVVPLYDDTGRRCIGTLTHSEKPACRRCARCHRPDDDCATGGELPWWFERGFSRDAYLYNYAGAAESRGSFVVLAAGEELVWKASAVSCPAVASLGELSEGQAEKLAALGTEVRLADNDPGACGKARELLEAQGVRVRPYPVPWGDREVATVTPEEVRRWLCPSRAG